MGVLIVAALPSCSIKEDVPQHEPTPARVFRAVLEQQTTDHSTKTYVNSDYKLYWNEGDKVSIFYGYTFNREYEFAGFDGATAGEFKRVGVDPEHFTEDEIDTEYDYAILPYADSRRNGCDTYGVLTAFIMPEQEYYVDHFGIGAKPLMVARDKGGALMFKHVGSYLGVRLKGDGVAVSSVSVQGNDSETLAGRLSISFDDNGVPHSEFVYNAINSNVVSMNLETPVELDNEDYTVFWFNLPEITFEKGFTVTVNDVSGGSFQKVVNQKAEFKRTYFNTASANVVISNIPVSSVEVTPSELTLDQEQSQVLSAEILPENASDKTIIWTTSDENVAIVDNNGKVTAVGAGTAIITASAGEKSATCSVSVNDKITYELAIAPESETIKVGEIVDFTFTLTTLKNGEVESTAQVANVTLTASSDIVSIDGNTAEGVSAGEAIITAIYTPSGYDPIHAEAIINVVDNVSYRLALTPDNAEIIVNGEQLYKAILTTITNDKPVESEVVATLSVNSTAVAEIHGMSVKGLKSGTAIITASYKPEGETTAYTATSTLVVKEISYKLVIDPDKATINAGEKQQFTTKLITITDGVESEGVVVNASLTSSNVDVATVSGSDVKGVAEGVAVITASYKPDNASNEINATAELTVKDVISYSVAISPTSDDKPIVYIGKTCDFILTLTTITNGNSSDPVEVTAEAQWTSSNNEIAEVVNGKVTAKKEGKVVITAKYSIGNIEYTESAELTVYKDPNTAGDEKPIEGEETL